MEVDVYKETEGGKFISVVQGRTRITASSEENKRVRVCIASVAGRGDCERIEISLDECFTCEDWQRLLCELGRVCGCSPCEPWDWARDDDDDCGCEDAEVVVSVRELRAAIKGHDADDLIRISQTDDE